MPWDQYGSPIGEDENNPLIVSPLGGPGVPIVLAKGVTDADGTTSQFADGTKNFETGAFVGKMAKLTIDEIDYYRTILTNTGGTVTINTIVDVITIPSGTVYEILDYGLVNKFVPTDTDGDEKFTSVNPAVMQLSGSNMDLRGTSANKPLATAVTIGATYWSVDTDPHGDVIEVSNGTSWVVI